MNPHLDSLLTLTDSIMSGQHVNGHSRGPVHVGVDLGTAYTVLAVLDENDQPIGGAYQFAQVARDGLVVDFVGAVELLRQLKADGKIDGQTYRAMYVKSKSGIFRSKSHVIEGFCQKCNT